MNRDFCLQQAAKHKRESISYREDAETALTESVGDLKKTHFDYFVALSARHAQDAEDWMVKANGENE